MVIIFFFFFSGFPVPCNWGRKPGSWRSSTGWTFSRHWRAVDFFPRQVFYQSTFSTLIMTLMSPQAQFCLLSCSGIQRCHEELLSHPGRVHEVPGQHRGQQDALLLPVGRGCGGRHGQGGLWSGHVPQAGGQVPMVKAGKCSWLVIEEWIGLKLVIFLFLKLWPK